MALLIECARRELTAEHRRRVRALLRRDLDRRRLVEMAFYHKMAPLLHWHLEALAGEMNGDAELARVEGLRSLCMRNASRMLRLTGELLRLLRTFEGRGILAVPYKGPALSHQLYGNLTLRQSVDLDIVVRRRDARRARELLIESGYGPRHALSRADVAFMIDNRYHETFVGTRAVLELHWAFSNRDVGFPLELEDLAPRLRPLSLGGHDVRTFAPDDLLLLLSVHGAKHRWDRVEWVCGVAELIRSGGVDAEAALERAAALGARRVLLLGLGVAHELLDAPLSEGVLSRIDSDARAVRLRHDVVESLRAGRDPDVGDEPVDSDFFQLQLREGFRDRLRFLWDRITTPSDPGRWSILGLGPHYFRLHAVFRPWSVVAKLVTILRRRVQGPRVQPPRAGPPAERSDCALRILQICQRPQRRGAEVFAHQLTAELRRQGHAVSIAYLYPHWGQGRLPLGPGDHMLQGDEDHPLETLIGARPRLVWRLKTIVQDIRPDIIQVNGARTVKYGTFAKLLLGGAAGAVVYRNIGAPDDWLHGPRRKLFYRAILSRLDGVVALSPGSLEALSPRLSDRTPRTVISNAIDPASLEPAVPRARIRQEAATPADAPVAIFVGSLGPEKRVDRLIDAVGAARERAPDLHLWIVGDGPLRPDLERRAERAGLGEAVRFFGVRQDVASYLAAADLLALVSDTEGVPGVVLEAGYLGLPVLATRVGAIPELIRDGETGLLVEAGDDDALVAALAGLAGDPKLRARLGTRGHEAVAAAHTIERVAGEYLGFYRTVCGKEARRGERVRPAPEAGAGVADRG